MRHDNSHCTKSVRCFDHRTDYGVQANANSSAPCVMLLLNPLLIISFDCSRILTISQFFKIVNVVEEHSKGSFIASDADNNGFRV